ncbi:MAG: hypothetical protein K0R51_3085 [Cytophagaceae bacterium]|jgi:hypothetical protein|nr:hypothetical protein [Cytophagaceae bacterium]
MNLLFLKKSKAVFLVLFYLLTASKVFAQDSLIYVNFDWSAKPIAYRIDTTSFKDELEVYLLNNKGYEFAYDKENDGELVEFELTHRIIKVNSDDAIERNNKVYIPKKAGAKIIKQKARVIKANGKIKELNESNIKESFDEETQKSYTYFAVDNIEKGDQIEYFYIVKKRASYTGSCIYLQSDVPRVNTSVEVLAPVNLIFAFKSYNNFPALKADTIYKNKNRWKASLANIEAIKREKMAAYDPSLMQVVFKLKDNTAYGKKDVVSYSNIASDLYQEYYTKTTKAAQSEVKKMLKKINIPSSATLPVKIRTIEDYIKQNYFFVEGNGDGLGNLDMVLKTHKASAEGLVALFVTAMAEAGVNHELVLTCNRYEYTFDTKFEAYYLLQDYLLYFPEIDSYLEPASIVARLGYVTPHLTNNNGLFIKRVKLGEFESAVGKIKFINPIPYDLNQDIININAVLNEEEKALKIEFGKEQMGYYANSVQLIFDLLNDEQKKELNKSLITSIIPNVESDNMKMENTAVADFGVKPLLIKADFSSEELVEKAGTKYIIKIGLLIGPQMELYQEEKRKLPVMNDFKRRYVRKITFKIPAGYDIKNLESLKFNVTDNAKDIQAAFISNYKIEGDMLIVTIDEYYKRIDYSVTEYEAFRAVINAAADFNESTIFLEKK